MQLKHINRILKRARESRIDNSKFKVLRSRRSAVLKQYPIDDQPLIEKAMSDPDQGTIDRSSVRDLAQQLGRLPVRAELRKLWKITAEETSRRVEGIGMGDIKNGSAGRPKSKLSQK